MCSVYHLVRLEQKLRNKTEPRFCLSSKTSHKAISPSMLCGWLKEVITASGSMAGMTRDVRSVGAYTTVQARLDIKQVMAAGNWTRLSTASEPLAQ